MSDDLVDRLIAAEKTIAVLKRKVIDLYNGDRTGIQHQVALVRRREAEHRRRRELAEVKAAELTRYNETLELEVERRTAAMHMILDNVTFGFLVVGRDLMVQPETTRSCESLFGSKIIEGSSLIGLLQLDAIASAEFALACDQVFDDFLPEEVSLAQIRTKFPLASGRILRAEARPIRSNERDVRALLFSISDITELEEATRESHQHRVLVGILRQREAFVGFLIEARSMLEAAQRNFAAGDLVAVRRAIHTIKGSAASFGVVDVVERCHSIEGLSEIGRDEIVSIGTELREFLQRNHGVLGLDLDQIDEQPFTISRQQIQDLLAITTHATPELSRRVQRWSERVVSRPAAILLGPIEEVAKRLADKLGKEVALEVEGADTAVDVEVMRPVLMAVGHLIRNAISHGIELPHERGEKPRVGKLELAISKHQRCVEVSLHDDGRGIDLDRLRERAKRIVGLEPADVDDPLSLIFVDGVSTADVTSTVSGRGVGMAAVRSTIEAAGGTMSVSSTPGRGTRVVLSVPDAAADVDRGPSGLSVFDRASVAFNSTLFDR